MIPLIGALVAVLFLALAEAKPAQADEFVTTTLDSGDGTCDATCSLRDAVANAVDETIHLGAGTYEITEVPLDLTEPAVVIDGPGARSTTIRSDGFSSIGTVRPGADAVFQDVTVTGGRAVNGGAFTVDAGGVLRIVRAAVVGNVATQNGGAVYSLGDLRVADSTLSGNTAGTASTPGRGGAVFATDSMATFRNSTISGNTAIAVEFPSMGGGLYLDSDTFSLDHVTIAGNRATTGNGGGLFTAVIPADEVAVRDTLIAGNTGGACGGLVDQMLETANLADDTSCHFTEPDDLQVADAKIAALANNGGGTNTHALLTGSPAIDAAGPNRCLDVDQRGQTTVGATCDIGAFEGTAASPPPPPPPPPPPQGRQLPPPVIGKSVNVVPESGTVLVKRPGAKKFLRLTEGQQLPVGTVVDTRQGRVTLVAAANKSGGTATAVFYDGLFKLTQSKGARPITTLTLVEKLTGCKVSRGKASAAKKKPKKRRLWGDGKGRFRTKGQFSSATVRGTRWLVEDRCTTTLTRVARGKVEVRDFVKRKTVLVKAGKRYIARRR